MQEDISRLAQEFKSKFPTAEREEYWRQAANAFKAFWNNIILSDAIKDLKGKEIDFLDPMVRLMDVNGKRTYSFSGESEHQELKQRILESGKRYGLEYEIKETQNSLSIMSLRGATDALKVRDICYLSRKSHPTAGSSRDIGNSEPNALS